MISDNECVQVRIRNPEKENHHQSKNDARESKLPSDGAPYEH